MFPVNRRQCLQMLGLSMFVGSASAAPTAKSLDHGIIDTHTHFYDPTRPQGVPWPSPNSPVLYQQTLPMRFRSIAAKHGVTGTVVVEASPWLEDNEWLLDIAADEPFIVGIIGNLNPADEAFPTQLARFAANPLYRGIRILGKSFQGVDAASPVVAGLRLMEERELTLDVNGNGTMLADVVTLATLMPSLRIVINHLPIDPLPDPEQQRQAEAALAKLGDFPNVYIKVSHVLRKKDGVTVTGLEPYRAKLESLWDQFGPDRTVYGSNWPVSDLFAPYDEVIDLVKEFVAEKGEDVALKYFRDNSKAAYQWIDRG